MRLRVGLFGHVGNGNLGDEALFGAVIENVRGLYPDAEMVGFTIRPADTEQRHGIRAYPIRRLDGHDRGPRHPRNPTGKAAPTDRARQLVRQVPLLQHIAMGLARGLRVVAAVLREPGFLAASVRRLRGIDILLVFGSQSLMDTIHPKAWGTPYTLLKWIGLARLMGARVALLSVGAGPLRTWLGRAFVRRVLGLATYRSFRDERSLALVAELGSPAPNHFAPDLAFRLSLPPTAAAPNATSLRIGINPMAFKHAAYWHDSDSADMQAYDAYAGTLTELVLALGARGHEVLLFPTAIYSDPIVIADLAARVGARGGQVEVASVESQQDLVNAIDRCDITVDTRYHAILFSLLRHRPAIAVAYHGKSSELMTMVGLPEFVLEIDDLDAGALIAMVLELAARRQEAAGRIAERLPTLRAALGEQYRDVLADTRDTATSVLVPAMAQESQ